MTTVQARNFNVAVVEGNSELQCFAPLRECREFKTVTHRNGRDALRSREPAHAWVVADPLTNMSGLEYLEMLRDSHPDARLSFRAYNRDVERRCFQDKHLSQNLADHWLTRLLRSIAELIGSQWHDAGTSRSAASSPSQADQAWQNVASSRGPPVRKGKPDERASRLPRCDTKHLLGDMPMVTLTRLDALQQWEGLNHHAELDATANRPSGHVLMPARSSLAANRGSRRSQSHSRSKKRRDFGGAYKRRLRRIN